MTATTLINWIKTDDQNPTKYPHGTYYLVSNKIIIFTRIFLIAA